MSRDEAREHIRAAQEAEIAGNREGAVRHLERAALAYVRVGLHGKAAQMYRNCLRLAPDRADLKDSLEKAESWAAKGSPVSIAEAPPVVSSEGFDALAIPRGPQRAMPGLEAWCSFCCRPTKEAGELVAGPAGAFICASCVQTSGEMLEVAPQPAPAREPPTQALHAVERPRSITWLGLASILEAARAALAGRGPSLVVLGPEGSGKSALLDALASELQDAQRFDCARPDPIPSDGAVLAEHLDLASPEVRARLASTRFVATWRADVEPELWRVTSGDAEVVLPIAREFSLPPELDAAAIALPRPDAELLSKILERDLADHDGPILAAGAQEALVARALESPRSAKALLAELGLLRSLPPGAPVGMASAAARKRTRRKRS